MKGIVKSDEYIIPAVIAVIGATIKLLVIARASMPSE